MSIFNQVPGMINDAPQALVAMCLIRMCRPILLFAAFWTASRRTPDKEQMRLFGSLATAIQASRFKGRR